MTRRAVSTHADAVSNSHRRPIGINGADLYIRDAAADAVALVTAPANWPAAIQVTALLGPSERSVSVLACNFTGAAADPGPVSFRYLVIEF